MKYKREKCDNNTKKKLLFCTNPFFVVPKKMGVYRVGGKGALSHQRLEKGIGGRVLELKCLTSSILNFKT